MSAQSINGPYVDGISITYGTPRRHIWSYGIGFSDKHDHTNINCPCSEFPGRLSPSFVHEHYYCESGNLLNTPVSNVFIDDPMWDGENCSSGNNCCSEPSLPWFYRQIPLTTSKDIEARICRDEASNNEDVLVREFQLYVK